MEDNRQQKRKFDWAELLKTARILIFAVLFLGVGFRVSKDISQRRAAAARPPAAESGETLAESEGDSPEQPRKRDLKNSARPSYMIYYKEVTDAVIEEAKQYDVVILHPKNGDVTREQVQAIRQGGTVVLGYLSIGEDLRTNEMTAEEMLKDARFMGDGTGPRVDPRAMGEDELGGIDPMGDPSPAGTGFASYYLDDNDLNGFPDFNPSFRCAYTNIGDPAWFDALNGMTLDGVDGVPGIREILTDDYGRGLGCDGLFLDTIDTCAPNRFTSDEDPNRTRFEWTAPGAAQFMKRLKEEYPDKYLLQNRGLFFYNYSFPQFDYAPREYVDFLMYESYMLDSNSDVLYYETFFSDNQYMHGPKIIAEANRPDGFQVLSLGYAEGPEEYQLRNTLLGRSNVGLDILLEDIRQAEGGGSSHYITDKYLALPNHFVLEHEDQRDSDPPVWTSVHNLSGVYPYEAPTPRVGIGEAEPMEGGVIVRWDVATDKNGVDYTLYYQKTPFDFTRDPDLTAAESLELVPEAGEGYGYQAPPESYPYQAAVEGLDPGETYYFIIRAKDRSHVENEEKNTVVLEGVPLG